jgi:hypothetical protein
MTYGAKPLRKILLGKEPSSVAGTFKAPTTYWRGQGVLEDLREAKVVDEDIGILIGVDRNTIPKLEGQIELESVECAYEQIIHVLGAGIKLVSSTADGTGSGHVWTYPMPYATTETIQTYTIQAGDNAAVEQMTYAFCSEFTIEGAAGEPIMISSTWRGRSVEPSTGWSTTAGIPVITDMLFGNCKLYINDTDTGSPAQVSAQFLGFTFNMKTGFMPVWTGDGQTYFTFVKMSRPETTCEIVLEHSTAAIAEKAKWRAGTSRYIRIVNTGPATAVPGSGYGKKMLHIEMGGRWDKFGGLEDQDDDDIVTGTFRVLYNVAAASAGQIIVVNELDTVP